MPALTADVKIIRFGSPGNSTQPMNFGLTANAKVFRGSVATTRSGYLVAASSPTSTDIVWGLVEDAGPGTIDGGPGITGGSTNGLVTADVATGSFFLQNGTGADAMTEANVGAPVYLINEITVGLTNGGATRPVAGVLLGMGSSLGNITPFSSLVAIKVGSNLGTTGGPS